MIDRNSKTNLLEEKFYNYSLQDVKEPELFRDLYPYDEIPKVVFNYRNGSVFKSVSFQIEQNCFHRSKDACVICRGRKNYATESECLGNYYRRMSNRRVIYSDIFNALFGEL